MNLLRRIKIENIKGKDVFEITFTDFNANQPNIVVAPNGYGKSTIATAFDAATNGKMKLNDKDIYQGNLTNKPKLEIELHGDNAGTYVSTDTDGDISRNITLYTINSSLYAKNTTQGYGGNIAATADLRVEQIIVYNQIPENCSLDYAYRDISSIFGARSKLYLNISDMVTDYDNIKALLDIKAIFKKCAEQPSIQAKFSRFIDRCAENGTSKSIKEQITQAQMEPLYQNTNIKTLLDCISNMNNKPNGWCKVDEIFTAMQLCVLFKQHLDAGRTNILKKTYTFLYYKQIRAVMDKRLELFNTTGRRVKTQAQHGKLVIDFVRASSMSNGERDILTFIANLTKFKISFKKKVGILIIDEVFDYLDGSNMLAVQYYLSKLIADCKSSGKVLFPIILTHLDPESFANYYFSKKKIHYISSSGTMDIESAIVKLLRLREERTIVENEKEEIEKYYIHYINETYFLTTTLAARVLPNFNESNVEFRRSLYSEITDKYLLEHPYNPIAVVAGIRIRIEELVCNRLNETDHTEFFRQHTVIKKLKFAESRGLEIPELYYLLQPMYNDSLHLRGDNNTVMGRMKSCYLKTDNLHVRNMVQMLFD